MGGGLADYVRVIVLKGRGFRADARVSLDHCAHHTEKGLHRVSVGSVEERNLVNERPEIRDSEPQLFPSPVYR